MGVPEIAKSCHVLGDKDMMVTIKGFITEFIQNLMELWEGGAVTRIWTLGIIILTCEGRTPNAGPPKELGCEQPI